MRVEVDQLSGSRAVQKFHLRFGASRFAGRCIHDSLADFLRSSDMKLNTFHMNRSFKRCRAFWLFYHHVYLVKVLFILNRSLHLLIGKRHDNTLPFPVRTWLTLRIRITFHNGNGDTVAVELYGKLTSFETVHVHP